MQSPWRVVCGDINHHCFPKQLYDSTCQPSPLWWITFRWGGGRLLRTSPSLWFRPIPSISWSRRKPTHTAPDGHNLVTGHTVVTQYNYLIMSIRKRSPGPHIRTHAWVHFIWRMPWYGFTCASNKDYFATMFIVFSVENLCWIMATRWT